MTVTVVGDDMNDIRQKVGVRGREWNISIRWKSSDYGRVHEKGCVVEFDCALVPMEFDSAGKALRYISGLLKSHDKYAAEKQAEHRKEMKTATKSAKKAKK